MTLNTNLDSGWIGSKGEAICKQSLAARNGLVYELCNISTGLHIEVTERFAGNFCVKITDTDADKVVGIKMFPKKQMALDYADFCAE